MSHFTVLKTKFADRDGLVRALGDAGFKEGVVEVHDEPQTLYGFQGDPRPEKAEVVIRRKHLGSASNDLGFARGDDGTFTAVVSSYDRARFGKPWLERLTQRYAYHVTVAKLAEQGFEIAREETDSDGRLRLALRKRF
jgi:hypothetical protein